MLHTVTTLATHDEIGAKLQDRYGDRVDRIEFSLPVNTPDDAEVLTSIITALQSRDRSS